MKLIVDFDDVLFDASKLKEKLFTILEEYGVQKVRERYLFERESDRPFSLRLFIGKVLKEEGVSADIETVYDRVMSICSELRNEALLTVLKQNGKDHCLLVTSGEEEFQREKIQRSGIDEYANVVVVVPGSKKDEIEAVCAQFPNEEIIFIDDKNKFFTDIDMEKCPNLKTVLYNENGLENLKAEIAESRSSELRRINQNKDTNFSGPKMR